MDEHRSTIRRQTSRRGKIQFDRTREIAVTVRNLSATGAMLEMSELNSRGDIPKEFTLHISDKSHQRNCKIVWLQPPKMGVRFL